jgi:solute carrier family 12 sodium/potassium/chloride transporter 2
LYISYRKPEANWGSSTQAQQFVLALKNVQSLNDVPDHVKNYRPKLLVFTGLPIHRQPLVDFGYLITKKLSLMICSHMEPKQTSKSNLGTIRKNVNAWLKDRKIKAFFSVTQDESFSVGAKNCMNLVGIGKLTPNMAMLGFKSDWQKDEGLDQYIDVIHHGFDIQLAMGILRLPKGCDYSRFIDADTSKEESIEETEPHATPTENGNAISGADDLDAQEKSKSTFETTVAFKKTSNATYHGADGNPLSKEILADITQFQVIP